MNTAIVGIELEDITNCKWWKLEKELNFLLELSGITGKFKVDTLPNDGKAVVTFTLEYGDINYHDLPETVPDENGNIILKPSS